MKYRVTIVAEFDSRQEIKQVIDNIKVDVEKAKNIEYKVFEVEEIGYKKIKAEDLIG